MVYFGIRWKCCCKTSMMNSTLNPLRVTVIGTKVACPSTDNFDICRRCRGGASATLDERLKCLHFTEKERLTCSIQTITYRNSAVDPKRTVSRKTRHGIVN